MGRGTGLKCNIPMTQEMTLTRTILTCNKKRNKMYTTQNDTVFAQLLDIFIWFQFVILIFRLAFNKKIQNIFRLSVNCMISSYFNINRVGSSSLVHYDYCQVGSSCRLLMSSSPITHCGDVLQLQDHAILI